MLKITNLKAAIEDNSILNGINLEVTPGEVHAIMGPNGSGKSTLANVLAGREEYEVTGGTVEFLGEDLLELEPNERAIAGLFLAFQYPVEIPGVNNSYFLRAGLNAIRKERGEQEMDALDFLALARETLAVLDETDSGLDIDALKIVADGVNALRGGDRGIIVVTHYQRLLNYIVPDFVHVLHNGRIVKSGDKSLALQLEERGYSWLQEETASAV